MERRGLASVALVIALMVLVLVGGYLIQDRDEEPPPKALHIFIAFESSYDEFALAYVGLYLYELDVCLGFFSGGTITEENVTAMTLDELEHELSAIPADVEPSFLLIRESPSPGPKITVFLDNSTVAVEVRQLEDLAAAVDKLILSVSGPYALNVVKHEGRFGLMVVHPDTGEQIGLGWAENLTMAQAQQVPVLDPQGVEVDPLLIPEVLLKEYYIGS